MHITIHLLLLVLPLRSSELNLLVHLWLTAKVWGIPGLYHTLPCTASKACWG